MQICREGGAGRRGVRLGCNDLFAADHPPDPQAAHQRLHLAAAARQAIARQSAERGGDVFAVATQNMSDLPCAIELAVVLPDPVDLEAQGGIGLGTGRRPVRITCNGALVIVSGRGKLQRIADRLDPE